MNGNFTLSDKETEAFEELAKSGNTIASIIVDVANKNKVKDFINQPVELGLNGDTYVDVICEATDTDKYGQIYSSEAIAKMFSIERSLLGECDSYVGVDKTATEVNDSNFKLHMLKHRENLPTEFSLSGLDKVKITETFGCGVVEDKGIVVDNLSMPPDGGIKQGEMVVMMASSQSGESKLSTVWYIVRLRDGTEYYLCDVDENTGQRSWTKNIDDRAYLFLSETIARNVWESLGKIGKVIEIPVTR